MLTRIEIGIDAREPELLATFWSTALGYGIGDFDRGNVYLDLVPPSPSFPIIYLQRVTEDKTTKNRLHLDLYVDDPEEVIESLIRAGAQIISEERTGSNGGWWRILADPEGNEFCVCRARSTASS